MSYIGKTPTVGNFQVCDAISVVNGQAAYTMQVDSVNVVPESANHMLVSLNGILQKPGSSFTVSGSTITFASALSTGDVIDFITLLGNVLDLGTPSDATVTNAKTNFTSTSSAAGLQIKGDGTTDGTLQLNCSQNSHGIKLASPAHSAGQSYKLIFPTVNVTADRFLKVDSVSGSGTTGIGQLSFAEAGGGLVKITTASGTGSSGIIDITGCFTSTYENYEIRGVCFVDATEQVKFSLLNTSGSVYGSYYNLGHKGYSNNSSTDHEMYRQWANSNFGLAQNHSDSTTRGSQIRLQIYQPRVTGVGTKFECHQHTYDGSYFRTGYMMGGLNDATEIAGIRIKMSGSANFRTQTKITVYGLV